MLTFDSLLLMLEELQTENDCRQFLEELRWKGKPVCPHCGSISDKHYKLKEDGVFEGQYKCRDCRKRFTVTMGTMFEKSHVSLKKWFYAIYLFTSHKKGISSVQLAKDIKVSQKTACICLVECDTILEVKTKFLLMI